LKQRKAEFCEWKWTNINDLPKIIVPFKKKLYESIIKEFEIYLKF